MDSRQILERTIRKALFRLALQWTSRQLVKGLAAGIWTAVLFLIVTRFFIMPGYSFYALAAGIIAVLAVPAVSFGNRPKRRDALRVLDRHAPDNLILAAGTLPTDAGPLADDLAEEAAKHSGDALASFRKTKGRWADRRSAAVSAAGLAVLLLTMLYPSPAQLEAKEEEAEREIVMSIRKEVEKLREKAADEAVAERLADLEEAVGKAAVPEEAIGETVKLQRELNLQERLENGAGSPESGDAGTLTGKEAAEALAAIAGNADEKLAKLGRSAGGSLASGEPAGENGTGGSENTGGDPPPGSDGGPAGSDAAPGSDGNSSGNAGGPDNGTDQAGGQGGAGQNGVGQDGAGRDGSAGNGTGQGGSGQGGSGQGGAGQGGSGQGGSGQEGSGQGDSGQNGSGKGGDGTTGSGAGMGQGSRDLVSTPPPGFDPRAPVQDTGKQEDGGRTEKGTVPAGKGTVRPYGEATGDYRDAYLEDAGRLGLPEDLQRILSDYFSSIENRD